MRTTDVHAAGWLVRLCGGNRARRSNRDVVKPRPPTAKVCWKDLDRIDRTTLINDEAPVRPVDRLYEILTSGAQPNVAAHGGAGMPHALRIDDASAGIHFNGVGGALYGDFAKVSAVPTIFSIRSLARM